MAWLYEHGEPTDAQYDDRWVGRALRFLTAQHQRAASGERSPRLDPAVRVIMFTLAVTGMVHPARIASNAGPSRRQVRAECCYCWKERWSA